MSNYARKSSLEPDHNDQKRLSECRRSKLDSPDYQVLFYIFDVALAMPAIRHIVLTKLFQGDEGKMNSICEKFIYYMDLIQFLENKSEIFSTSMSRLHKLILEKFLAELCLDMEVENGSSGEHQLMTEMFMVDKGGQTVEVTLSGGTNLVITEGGVDLWC